MNEARGWLGMFGSIDCMHLRWKKCHAAWHDQYTSQHHDTTILLEAVTSKDLWILHCFFVLPSSLNDINVMQRSHFFLGLLVEMLHLATTPLMDMTIPCRII